MELQKKNKQNIKNQGTRYKKSGQTRTFGCRRYDFILFTIINQIFQQ